MVKRPVPPGYDRRKRPGRVTQYGIQLREKQKVKRIYGLLEKQFANLVKKVSKTKGKSGEELLIQLERRLDNAVYRAGFAASRRAARQLVNHGHFLLNGRKADIASITLNPGDMVEVKPKSKKNQYFAILDDLTAHVESPKVGWLSVNKAKLAFKVISLPKREDAEADINEQLIIEFYSR